MQSGTLRFTALGDSITLGIGDKQAGSFRGWARLLADAMSTAYAVDFSNLSVAGATAGSLLREQVPLALEHPPQLASLIVGINDTMRSTWDPAGVRRDVLAAADALAGTGATLMTARFHDHPSMLRLPARVRRAFSSRIALVNDAYDEVVARHGGLRVDLAHCPEVFTRDYWACDRVHPAEGGHRMFARRWAAVLAAEGLVFTPPPAETDTPYVPGLRTDLAWLVVEGLPWFGRRAGDLATWAVRMAWVESQRARRAQSAAPVIAMPEQPGLTAVTRVGA
ncbi:GDSL family lipase [Nocardioides gansuensis]|uniref:GDSL family lipase n=1 Tax=Nocardioides gansuensis TaxID=2138300 RepID=A0A2T8F5S8_9ACTN|nr:SGNH/GDSL hydrolase family protein [Nocardioides gansuensis]PVG81064.1 GDSL family lipase [Nocardioides gansuensis]